MQFNHLNIYFELHKIIRTISNFDVIGFSVMKYSSAKGSIAKVTDTKVDS